METSLLYGKQEITVKIPASASVLGFHEPPFTINKIDFQTDLLQALPDEKSKYRKVGIVVSDKTRLCGYPEFLPWIVEILLTQGASKENICFFIAYGTHSRQTEEESLHSYGEIYKEYKFIHHNCDEAGIYKTCGITQRGTPITIRQDIWECGILITVGAISHHYFAAYGGGRKLIFPGLASRNAIYHNHGLFLDKKNKSLAQTCQPGNLTGNPLAGDLQEIDSYMPPKISVHVLMNASGKPCQYRIGHTYDDFVAACRLHDSFYRYNSSVQYDLVLASSGGYPKDINFIQAHKSIHHAAAFVKDGGKLVVLSECTDGIGSENFMKYMETGNFETAFGKLEKNYEGNGGTALSMMLKTGRIQICMLTSLNEGICKILGILKIEEGEIEKFIRNKKESLAIIHNASILIK